MKKLSEKVKSLITSSVKVFGTYEPNLVLSYIQEELTIPEYNQVYKFLDYLHKNNLCYGWGNFDEVWKRYTEIAS